MYRAISSLLSPKDANRHVTSASSRSTPRTNSKLQSVLAIPSDSAAVSRYSGLRDGTSFL